MRNANVRNDLKQFFSNLNASAQSGDATLSQAPHNVAAGLFNFAASFSTLKLPSYPGIGSL